MTPAAKKVIWAWFVLVLPMGATVSAITSDTSSSTATGYEGIAERNIFGLKPPPPPAPPADTVKPPALKITLTGITTFGGKKALMKTTGAIKPGEAAKEQYYILREQEKDGEIEVLQIDEKNGMVKVMNSGTEQTLTFDKDGVKPPGPGPGATPVAGAPHPGGLLAPPPTPGFTPNPAVGGFKQGFPPRTPRIPGQAETSAATPVTPASVGGFSPVPTPVPQPQAAEQPAIPYEQQLVLMELERERTKEKVLRCELPPIPFTELTPSDAVGARQQTPNNPNPTTRPYGQRGPFPQ